jgi:hypothetical protein
MSLRAHPCSVALLAFLALLLPGTASPARAQQAPNSRIPLRILYAGHPGSAREADFLSFLTQHFRQVDAGDFARLDAKKVKEAGVVLLDYDSNGFSGPRCALPKGYARPTVTIGVIGGLLCSQLRLKTGYM